MKLLNLIKCHLSYLLSKSSIAIIIIVNIILFIVYITNALALDLGSVKEAVDNYYEASLTMTRIIFVLLSCFITSNSFTSKNDAYLALLITSGIKKEQYYLTKVSSIVFILFINIFVLCLLYLLSGFIFIKGFVYDTRFINAFLCIYIIALIYSLYTNLLITTFKNLFTFLLPTLASILTSSLAQGKINTFKKILFIFFPTTSPSQDSLFYSIYISIALLIILLITSLVLYVRVDKRSE